MPTSEDTKYYQRIRVRAMNTLARRHPDEFKRIMEELKAEDLRAGRTYVRKSLMS